jgi:hypothetical protein
MGFLDKLLHRSSALKSTPASAPAPCIHGALVPRWDNAADMGQEDKTTGYRCDACGKEFTPDEARGLQAQAADRLRALSEPPSPN